MSAAVDDHHDRAAGQVAQVRAEHGCSRAPQPDDDAGAHVGKTASGIGDRADDGGRDDDGQRRSDRDERRLHRAAGGSRESSPRPPDTERAGKDSRRKTDEDREQELGHA